MLFKYLNRFFFKQCINKPTKESWLQTRHNLVPIDK